MAARTLAMEVILYASGRRQLAEALRTAGIRRGTEASAVVLLGSADVDGLIADLGWTREDRTLSPEGKSLEALGIEPHEAATLAPERQADLALERVALVDLVK